MGISGSIIRAGRVAGRGGLLMGLHDNLALPAPRSGFAGRPWSRCGHLINRVIGFSLGFNRVFKLPNVSILTRHPV